jgi:hypothetical protein
VTFTIANASLEDLDLIVAFRIEASRWLARLGTDQWADPFPKTGINLRASILADESWIAWDQSRPVATITVTTWGSRNSGHPMNLPSQRSTQADGRTRVRGH